MAQWLSKLSRVSELLDYAFILVRLRLWTIGPRKEVGLSGVAPALGEQVFSSGGSHSSNYGEKN